MSEETFLTVALASLAVTCVAALAVLVIETVSHAGGCL